jgi:hypothetical protein
LEEWLSKEVGHGREKKQYHVTNRRSSSQIPCVVLTPIDLLAIGTTERDALRRHAATEDAKAMSSIYQKEDLKTLSSELIKEIRREAFTFQIEVIKHASSINAKNASVEAILRHAKHCEKIRKDKIDCLLATNVTLQTKITKAEADMTRAQKEAGTVPPARSIIDLEALKIETKTAKEKILDQGKKLEAIKQSAGIAVHLLGNTRSELEKAERASNQVKLYLINRKQLIQRLEMTLTLMTNTLQETKDKLYQEKQKLHDIEEKNVKEKNKKITIQSYMDIVERVELLEKEKRKWLLRIYG